MIPIRKKIIIVDDNLENLTAIKNTLKDIYDVYPAPSTSKMFDLLEHFLPDLILLDIDMPDINGHDTARLLKNIANYQKIPFVFVTGMHDEESEREGLSLGALDYIHKPFTAALLRRRIKMYVPV